MAEFDQSEIRCIKPGDIVPIQEDGVVKQMKVIFVCPYKGGILCPRVELYADDREWFLVEGCDMSPLTFTDTEGSVCMLVADLNNPSVRDTLNDIGRIVEFRKEKGE